MRDTLTNLEWPSGRKGGKVLELMAGYGRNYPVLKKNFRHVEMLDGSAEMWEHNNHPVTKHFLKIEDFKWPVDEYDCVLGVWCLCYLSGERLLDALAGMEKSVKELGYIVLMEPVLAEDSVHETVQWDENCPDEQARKQSWYERQFKRLGIKVHSIKRYPQDGAMLFDICSFVLQYGTIM